MLTIGNPMYMSWSLEGMAAVEVSRGDYRAAAVLCAARDAHLSRLESRLPPFNPGAYQIVQAVVGQHLDEQEIAKAAADGANRPIEELLPAFHHANSGTT